jgi:hypothetical protein
VVVLLGAIGVGASRRQGRRPPSARSGKTEARRIGLDE